MRSLMVALLALLAVIGGLLFLQLPEIRRYLKIRAM